MKKFFVFTLFILFFLSSCQSRSKPYTIGLDKSYFWLALDGQSPNLNGYITDLLLEISKLKKAEIELVDANWDSIFDNLKSGKFDAIFTNIEPLNYNVGKYDFSKDILRIGPALIVSKNAIYQSLNDMSNSHIGYLNNDKSLYVLQKYENIVPMVYDSIPQMLDDIKNNQIDGGVVPILLGYKYVNDLYQNDLKILEPLLNDESIKLITIKDKNVTFLKMINSAIDKLNKNQNLKKLKQKWGFYN